MDKIYPNRTDDNTATYLHETTVFVQREIKTIDDGKEWVLFIALLAVSFLIGVLSIVFIIRKKSKLVFFVVICFLVFLLFFFFNST